MVGKGAQKRVAIVGDDKLFVDLLGSALGERGVSARGLTSTALRIAPRAPDLTLLIGEHAKDGGAAVIEAVGATRGPFAVVVEQGDLSARIEARRRGVAIIAKSATAPEIADEVTRLVSGQATDGAGTPMTNVLSTVASEVGQRLGTETSSLRIRPGQEARTRELVERFARELASLTDSETGSPAPTPVDGLEWDVDDERTIEKRDDAVAAWREELAERADDKEVAAAKSPKGLGRPRASPSERKRITLPGISRFPAAAALIEEQERRGLDEETTQPVDASMIVSEPPPDAPTPSEPPDPMDDMATTLREPIRRSELDPSAPTPGGSSAQSSPPIAAPAIALAPPPPSHPTEPELIPKTPRAPVVSGIPTASAAVAPVPLSNPPLASSAPLTAPIEEAEVAPGEPSVIGRLFMIAGGLLVGALAIVFASSVIYYIANEMGSPAMASVPIERETETETETEAGAEGASETGAEPTSEGGADSEAETETEVAGGAAYSSVGEAFAAGREHLRFRRRDEARAAFEAAVVLDDTHAASHAELARILLDADEAEGAREHAERASRLRRRRADYHVLVAQTRAATGDAPGARRAYRRAFDLDPTNEDARAAVAE